MTLDITSLIIAAIVGLIVYFIARQVPLFKEGYIPALLGVLAAIAIYAGSLVITL